MIPTLFREPFHRTGVNHAKRFPGVAAAIAALPVPTLVLDGEVAIFDDSSARASPGCGAMRPSCSPRRRS